MRRISRNLMIVSKLLVAFAPFSACATLILHYMLELILCICASLYWLMFGFMCRLLEIMQMLMSMQIETIIAEAQALGAVFHSRNPFFGGVQRNVKSSSDNVLFGTLIDSFLFLSTTHWFYG